VTADDRIASTLTEIRESHRQHVSMSYPEPGICVSRDGRWPCDSARLLAAVEAALELADKLEPQGPPSSALEEDRMWIRQECADMIREAITREITGKGESDGQQQG
jgi:hypothetical protein